MVNGAGERDLEWAIASVDLAEQQTALRAFDLARGTLDASPVSVGEVLIA